MSKLSRLVLGTAQFQPIYGISGSVLQDSKQLALQVLEYADQNDIQHLDTSRSYGESEQLISSYGLRAFEVFTKIGNPPSGTSDLRSWYVNEVQQAKEALYPHNLTRVLMHDPDGFLEAAGSDAVRVADYLNQVFETITFGASLYTPQQWPSIRSIPAFKSIQFPLNPFDRRFIESGVAQEARDSGLVLQARSIFLQGVLLSEFQDLPPYFSRWGNLLTAWQEYSLYLNRSRLEICMAYVRDENLLDEVVVGVKSAIELDEVFNAYQKTKAIVIDDIWTQEDAALIDPRNWLR